ncbi:MAG TPA: hypothetical protein VMW11_09695 [Candidatus Dormibacteraeota bacterium]|nr:hypothetical protein [Candidatus Dormibacteraeota bacterium]
MVQIHRPFILDPGSATSGHIEAGPVDVLHVVTVSDGVPTDRVVYSSDQYRQLLAAGKGFAVEIDGVKADGSDTLAVVDLATGASRSLGSMSSLGIDDSGRIGGVVSPDGSRVAIGSNHKIVLIPLASGPQSLLLGPGDSGTWFIPLRWTSTGILVGEVGYEGPGYGRLIRVDPANGNQTVVSQAPNTQLVVSPQGQWLATTKYVDLGDGPSIQFAWQNTLNLTPVPGASSRIVSEKDRWFVPLDVSDDGELLFSSDTQTDSAVAPDMGIHLAANGRVVQQLSESSRGEYGAAFYGAARLVDPTTALIARMRGGFDAESSLDVELVHMCLATSSGCRVTTTTVSSTPGSYDTSTHAFMIAPGTN